MKQPATTIERAKQLRPERSQDKYVVSHSGQASPSKTLKEAQEALTTWEGILRATGGAIGADDDSKAFWYFIDFKYKKGMCRYKRINDLDRELKVRNVDNNIRWLKRLEPSLARESLGIYIAMDGNQRAELAYLREKASLYAEQIRTGIISRQYSSIGSTSH